MGGPLDVDSLTEGILAGFARWRREFSRLAARGRRRFADCDWKGMRADSVARLDLYAETIQALVEDTETRLGDERRSRDTWKRIHAAYARRIAGKGDRDLAETFFNSVTRQIFDTTGVDEEIEFVRIGAGLPEPADAGRAVRSRDVAGEPRRAVAELLAASALAGTFTDLDASVARIAERIGDASRIEVLEPLFYRGFGTYMIGRVRRRDGSTSPLAIGFLSDARGTRPDVVLLDEDEVSIVFSFSRSYFLVDHPDPTDLVRLLKTIMPRKPLAELYTALGYNRHGKTVFYRDLLRHLSGTRDRFGLAPGEAGLVMIVFTMPSYDIVFKIIRDRFAYPKTTVRKDVVERYRLVFRHDRAGRLADAQEFEHLSLPRRHFDDDLLAELAAQAQDTVTIGRDEVVLDHVYTERRMTPLNLFLKTAGDDARRAAISDYGRAVRDLAATNVFPGDLLLKNFGVTRHGRVIFYDYDEVTHLDAVRFRDLPQAPDGEDARAADWFYVGDDDVFPEEFRSFIGVPGEWMEDFEREHGDLFRAAWWREMQAQRKAGVEPRIFAYPDERRLSGAGAFLDGG